MILFARLPSNCSVRPNRGLPIRNNGSHSATPVGHPGTFSSIHLAGSSALIAPVDSPQHATRSRQSATKIPGPAAKSP